MKSLLFDEICIFFLQSPLLGARHRLNHIDAESLNMSDQGHVKLLGGEKRVEMDSELFYYIYHY